MGTTRCPIGQKPFTSICATGANKDGQSWPSLQTISHDLALSKSTVKRAIADLKAAEYLETEQRWRDNGGRTSLLFKLLK